MLKKAIFLIFISVTAFAVAQKTAIVHLPAAGDFAVIASHGAPTAIPVSPTSSKGGDVSLTLLPTDDTVSVWDKTSNNVASSPATVATKGWTPDSGSYKKAGMVEISVEQGGSPISAAEVQLSDGATREPQFVDATSAGSAKFFDVKPGKVTVTVRTKSGPPVTQIFQLDLARADVTPKFALSIAGVAATAPPPPPGIAATTTAATAPTAKPSPPPNTAGVIVVYFVAILAACGVGFAIVSYFKKNPGTVSEKLEQLGVQIPKPDNIGAAGGAPLPFDPQPKAAPIQKIILDDAAPTPLAAPFQPPAAVGTLSHEPTLVSSSGVPIPLGDGETVVGRDVGLGLSLTGETSISRRHASLVKSGTQVTLSDLGSTNGTFINGARLQAPTLLRAGDSVQFGSVQFRFQA